jgi:hypothetical protein
MKGLQALWHSIRFEVAGIRMRHWMLPKKSAQVRNHFETVALYVDTKDSIGKIRIPVAAPTSSGNGVELAVDEGNIGRSSRIPRGQTSYPEEQRHCGEENVVGTQFLRQSHRGGHNLSP